MCLLSPSKMHNKSKKKLNLYSQFNTITLRFTILQQIQIAVTRTVLGENQMILSLNLKYVGLFSVRRTCDKYAIQCSEKNQTSLEDEQNCFSREHGLRR